MYQKRNTFVEEVVHKDESELKNDENQTKITSTNHGEPENDLIFKTKTGKFIKMDKNLLKSATIDSKSFRETFSGITNLTEPNKSATTITRPVQKSLSKPNIPKKRTVSRASVRNIGVQSNDKSAMNNDTIIQSKKLLERADVLKQDFLRLRKEVDNKTDKTKLKKKMKPKNILTKTVAIKRRQTISPPTQNKSQTDKKYCLPTNIEDFNDEQLNKLVDQIMDTNPMKIMEKLFQNNALSKLLSHQCPLKNSANPQGNKETKTVKANKKQNEKSKKELKSTTTASLNTQIPTSTQDGSFIVYSMGPPQPKSEKSSSIDISDTIISEQTVKSGNAVRPKSANNVTYIQGQNSDEFQSTKSDHSIQDEITSNADDKQNITNFVAVSKHDNDANLNKNVLSWHIPRPSLISSQENSVYTSIGSSVNDYHNSPHRSHSGAPVHSAAGSRGYQNYRAGRGSTSTQGSSSSNNSTQSAKSGSLLLTVANLAKIDQEQLKIAKHNGDIGKIGRDQHTINLQYYLEQQNKTKKIQNDSNDVINTTTTTSTNNLVSPTKDVDTLSIASSTHFTVVNGLDRYRNKISQNNSCCRKHKLTVLTLTMSSIFMFGIIVAVYLFEMRAMHLRNS